MEHETAVKPYLKAKEHLYHGIFYSHIIDLK